MKEATRQICGTDIDIPRECVAKQVPVDIKERLEFLCPYLAAAESVSLVPVGWLEQKDCFRIRIKVVLKDKA